MAGIVLSTGLLGSVIAMQKIKQQIQKNHAYPIGSAETQENKLLESLPFDLTKAQNRVIVEIQKVFLAKYQLQLIFIE